VAAEAAAEASGRWKASGYTARAAAAHAKAARLCPREADHALSFILPLPGTPGLAMLTRREQEVALLACQGLSNTGIAGKLVVSVRTVESHLYSAYGKLGVSDRAELTAVLGSQYLRIARPQRSVGRY
jgi:DNA-binding NarL/FixJ family response regulator